MSNLAAGYRRCYRLQLPAVVGGSRSTLADRDHRFLWERDPSDICHSPRACRTAAELIPGQGSRWRCGGALAVMVLAGQSAGQGGDGLAGEAAGGDGLEQVVHGAGERPFGAGLGVAAHGQLAEAQIVLYVAVRVSAMWAAASRARASIGSNHPQSTGSSVSSVAMTSPSVLVMFWALYPWMKPPRTGISRESGSVMVRTGPGPLRARSRSAALCPASAARALAASTLAAACRTRQESS